MMLECFFGFGFGFGCTPMDRDERYDTMRHDFRREGVTRTHIREQCLSFCFHIWGTGNANISTGA